MVHLKKYKARSKPTTPPPVKWKGLMGLGDEFRYDPSEDNLTRLLEEWEKYWLWAWSSKPPTLECILDLWREILSLMDVRNEKDPPVSIRFTNEKRARGLYEQVNFEFIFGGLIVINAELSFLNCEALVFECMRPGDPKTKRWFEMILINRLMLALEWFTSQITISESWSTSHVYPSPYDVIVIRVQKALEFLK